MFQKLTFILISLVLLFSCGNETDTSNSSKTKDSESISIGDDAYFPFYKYRRSISAHKRATWGYMDKQGRRVVENNFFMAHTFTDGLGCVAIFKDRKIRHGYIDGKGNFAVKPTYLDARPFQESRALVCNDSIKWMVINKEGKAITEAKFDLASDYMNGYCYGYIFKSKKVRRGFLGGQRNSFYYDCYKIDKQGNETLIAENTKNTEYVEFSRLSAMNNLVMLWESDQDGDRLYGFTKISQDDFNQSPLSGCGNYLNEGTVIIKPQFSGAECFEGGYARVTLTTDESAYIDTTGTVLFTYSDDL